MPALRLIVEKIFRPIEVYITKPNLSLSKEIKIQLENVQGVKVVENNEKFDVIIHLVGFGESEYSETLSHTSELHSYLDKALKSKAKFVLVKTQNYIDLGKTAVTMLTQFGRLFKLDYEIVEIGSQETTTSQSAEVIKTFVHSFKPVRIEALKIEEVQIKKSNVKTTGYKLVFGLFLILAALQMTFVFGTEKWQEDQLRLKGGNFWNYLLTTNSFLAPIPKLVWEQKGGSFEALKNNQRQINGYLDGQKAYTESWRIFLEKPDLNSLENIEENLQVTLEKANFLQTMFANTKVKETRARLSKINSFFAELPYMLGMKSAVKYLILHQNEKDEVMSVTIATVENSKVTSNQNYLAETLDSQLKGEVIPPEDFKTATGISKWGIKYVNWDPDFNQVAAKAAWFVSKQLNVGVDVVVGTHINYSLLEKLSGESLLDKLESREITVVNLHNDKSQLSRVGWDGGLDYQVCKQTKGCVSDFLYNRNTFNVSPNQWLNIQIKPNNIEHVFRSIFVNSQNYWKVLIPGKVYAGQSNAADINYITPLDMDNSLKYRLSVPNQPGVKGGSLRINIKFDPTWKVIASEKAVVAMPGELEYNSDLSRPFLVDLTFNK